MVRAMVRPGRRGVKRKRKGSPCECLAQSERHRDSHHHRDRLPIQQRRCEQPLLDRFHGRGLEERGRAQRPHFPDSSVGADDGLKDHSPFDTCRASDGRVDRRNVMHAFRSGDCPADSHTLLIARRQRRNGIVHQAVVAERNTVNERRGNVEGSQACGTRVRRCDGATMRRCVRGCDSAMVRRCTRKASGVADLVFEKQCSRRGIQAVIA